MAILKPLSKHDTLANNKVRDYLLGIGQFEAKYGGNRAQKITYIGLAPDAPNMKRWAERMDEDRTYWKTDIPHNNKPVRTYNHYIFSPCPTDNVTVDNLDKALKEWCRRVFQNKFDIVIVYHNDNSSRVQHAHMIINNVNHDLSDKYRRISSYVTPQCWEYASQLWQYMCKERGWYSFIDKQKADLDTAEAGKPEDLVIETDNFTRSTENLFKIDEDYFKNHEYFSHEINYKRPYRMSKYKISKPYNTKFKRNYTNAALKAKKNGNHLWTDDIRDLIEISFFQSQNVKQFIGQLNQYGVNVELTKNKDFKYSHPADPQRRVTGAKLGRDYTRQQIYSKYSKIDNWSSDYTTATTSFNKKITPIVDGVCKSLITTNISLSSKNDAPTLHEVAVMIRTCAYLDSWTYEDLINDCLDGKGKNTPETIEKAAATLEKLDNFDIKALNKMFSINTNIGRQNQKNRHSEAFRSRYLRSRTEITTSKKENKNIETNRNTTTHKEQNNINKSKQKTQKHER